MGGGFFALKSVAKPKLYNRTIDTEIQKSANEPFKVRKISNLCCDSNGKSNCCRWSSSVVDELTL